MENHPTHFYWVGILVISLLAAEPSAALPAAEVQFIADLFTAFGDSVHSSWDPNNQQNYCSFIGIACTETDNIKELTITGNAYGWKLIGQLPESIGNLTELRQLSLKTHGIYGTVPKSLYTLPHIENIALSKNELEDVLPETWSPTLNTLFLPFNMFYGSLPIAFVTPPSQIVDLSRNALTCDSNTKNILAAWDSTPTLQHADVRWNKMRRDASTICGFDSATTVVSMFPNVDPSLATSFPVPDMIMDGKDVSIEYHQLSQTFFPKVMGADGVKTVLRNQWFHLDFNGITQWFDSDKHHQARSCPARAVSFNYTAAVDKYYFSSQLPPECGNATVITEVNLSIPGVLFKWSWLIDRIDWAPNVTYFTVEFTLSTSIAADQASLRPDVDFDSELQCLLGIDNGGFFICNDVLLIQGTMDPDTRVLDAVLQSPFYKWTASFPSEVLLDGVTQTWEPAGLPFIEHRGWQAKTLHGPNRPTIRDVGILYYGSLTGAPTYQNTLDYDPTISFAQLFSTAPSPTADQTTALPTGAIAGGVVGGVVLVAVAIVVVFVVFKRRKMAIAHAGLRTKLTTAFPAPTSGAGEEPKAKERPTYSWAVARPQSEAQ